MPFCLADNGFAVFGALGEYGGGIAAVLAGFRIPHGQKNAQKPLRFGLITFLHDAIDGGPVALVAFAARTAAVSSAKTEIRKSERRAKDKTRIFQQKMMKKSNSSSRDVSICQLLCIFAP